jgi:hypothetical protein
MGIGRGQVPILERPNWTLIRRIIGGLFALSALAMGAAAATADSDKGVRSDGSRVRPGSDGEDIQGDPKGGAPPFDEGDDTRPDSTTDEAKQAVAHGQTAEDTAANPDSADV